MANNDVWDAIAAASGTPANSFEFLVDLFRAGSFRRFADVTNVAPAFTDKLRARQTYASKGVDKSNKYGSNLVVTFDMEAVRDVNGLYQADLQDLIDASKQNGALNRRRMRFYDALGADYAFDGDFSINVVRTNTGWDDAGFYTITATQYTFLGWIANPVLTGNLPLIDAVTPNTGVATAATIYIEGEKFTGVTGAAAVKVGGTNATSYVFINDGLISAVVPAVSAGVQAVTVTTPVGTSAGFNITKV